MHQDLSALTAKDGEQDVAGIAAPVVASLIMESVENIGHRYGAVREAGEGVAQALIEPGDPFRALGRTPLLADRFFMQRRPTTWNQ